jgi:hypothetical protein
MALAACGLVLIIAIRSWWAPRANVGLLLTGVGTNSAGSPVLYLRLTNGTTQSVLLVDDTNGQPWVVLVGTGAVRIAATMPANSLRLSLRPGAALDFAAPLPRGETPVYFKAECMLRKPFTESVSILLDRVCSFLHIPTTRLSNQFERKLTARTDWISAGSNSFPVSHWIWKVGSQTNAPPTTLLR